jgi:hypothetical protein
MPLKINLGQQYSRVLMILLSNYRSGWLFIFWRMVSELYGQFQPHGRHGADQWPADWCHAAPAPDLPARGFAD